MDDLRRELVEARAELVLVRNQLHHERRIWCDRPEDRLYHAKDETWWYRDQCNRARRARPPEPVYRLAKEMLLRARANTSPETLAFAKRMVVAYEEQETGE